MTGPACCLLAVFALLMVGDGVVEGLAAVSTGELAMPSARAASPAGLSPYGSSCKHCITIAGEE